MNTKLLENLKLYVLFAEYYNWLKSDPNIEVVCTSLVQMIEEQGVRLSTKEKYSMIITFKMK